MIRAGFVIADRGDTWLGGINYRRNLLASVQLGASNRIEPILIARPDADPAGLSGVPTENVIVSPIADSQSALRYPRRLSRLLFGRDLLLEAFARKHRLDVLSHSGPTGARGRLPSVSWIPDFQHRRMPEFFTPEQRQDRDTAFRRLIEGSTLTIVSSKDALADLTSFAPKSAGKARVLHFVSGLVDTVEPVSEAALREQLGIDGPYFHLPNQFWAHKNHGVVVEAVALLKARGVSAPVIATGKPVDLRDANYVPELRRRIQVAGIEDMFRIVGIVELDVLQSLMLNAVALINPSKFEGWSSSVEEAKSLGKTILLSDIAVHREQAPEHGVYFPADEPGRLADAMMSALQSYNVTLDTQRKAIAKDLLPTRAAAFGSAYADILEEALQRA